MRKIRNNISTILIVLFVFSGLTIPLTINPISVTLRNGDQFLPIYTINTPTGENFTFFTIDAMTNSDGARGDYLLYLKEQLLKIGINLNVTVIPWVNFIQELLSESPDFDLCYVSTTGVNYDPVVSCLKYTQDNSLNYYGYETSMDYDVGLGTGINEWYLQQGPLMMPPDAGYRIAHYHDWQDYLMDNLLLMIPGFTPKSYMATWDYLSGLDMSDGIIQSWGKMSWSSLHPGQQSLDNFSLALPQWEHLNPLFMYDSTSTERLIQQAILDPLLWMDSDCTYWPHLAESYTYLNATHIRLELRSDIEWDEDPSSTFIGEQFDAEDVYFTLFCLKNLSSYQSQYQWLEDMVIIDDYTIDLFVDGDPFTPENEPDYIVLHSLTLPILPEHYLNQTQLVDGITPDITHYSWDEFDTEIFGTGLMTFDSFTEDYQTILKVKPDSWWLDPVITSDPNMDFDNRFGDIWDLLYLTIVAYSDPFIVDDYFTQGIIDYMPIDVSMVDDYNANTSLIVYNIVQNSLGEFGFNVRSSRGTPLQSTTACVGDPSTSIGLAIRKAIAYACNKTQINEEVNDGKNYINNHPIFPTLGVWLSGSITTFDCNLSQAQYYMELAGFDMDQDTDGDGLTDKDEVEIYGTDPEVADTDGDGWTDSEEIDQGTDPLDENDHPTASSPSPTTTYTFDVFTIISALFFTSLALALFVLDKQKRK